MIALTYRRELSASAEYKKYASGIIGADTCGEASAKCASTEQSHPAKHRRHRFHHKRTANEAIEREARRLKDIWARHIAERRAAEERHEGCSLHNGLYMMAASLT